MTVKINQAIPNFSFNATSDVAQSLADYRGKNVVLYFYPKDNTPGCTTESADFARYAKDFEAHNTVIFGLSRDSLKSHEGFKAKQCMPFELISDPDETICKLFDVIRQKSFLGKKYLGIDRSTFLIDNKGVLRQEWRSVKVPGHVAAVLAAVKTL